jgi:arsenite methyltransferase
MKNPGPTSLEPNYGVDAPDVLRTLFAGGVICMVIYFFLFEQGLIGGYRFSLGNFTITVASIFLFTGIILLIEGCLYLFYVKRGKFMHRDAMLNMHRWRGDEHVLDVGCGRGLLLTGAAKRLTTGRATGIDVWSQVDMGGNSSAATRKNLALEGVADKCELVTMPAEQMTFPDNSFDVVVSNLCLHNIKPRSLRLQACREIVRVLKPGGQAMISDFRATADYVRVFREANCEVQKEWGNPLTTFPPLKTVIIRKPA